MQHVTGGSYGWGTEVSFAQRMSVAARAHHGQFMKLVWPPHAPDAAALTNKVYMQLHRRQFECGGNTGSGARKRAYVTSVANGRGRTGVRAPGTGHRAPGTPPSPPTPRRPTPLHFHPHPSVIDKTKM